MLAPWKKSYDKPRQCIKKQKHYFADKGPSCQIYGFSSSHICMWELDHKESWVLKKLILLKCDAGKDSCEFLGLQGDQISQSSRKSVLNIHWKDGLKLKLWYFATWCKELTLQKRPWCWERLKAGGEGNDRGRKGWMPSPTQRTWACCRRCPAGDVLQEMVKDREAWHTALHGVTKSQTGLSDWTTMGEGRIPPHPNKESTSTTIIMLFSSSFLYS